ncbi:MAG: uracil-DNA glycosylase [Proteobacteria bacterium]|nr:uracil-DNA glycosylase [Pseudomonadota bacterium]
MDALALLRLQVEWGADEALEDAPVARVPARPARPAQPQGAAPAASAAARTAPGSAATARTAALPGPLIGTEAVAAQAAAAAAAAPSLAALHDTVAAFAGCALRATATHTVFAEGDPASGLLIVGGAPGAEEDRSGKPFSGPAGDYLAKMLASIGIARGQALLAPLIPWRPPGGRPPSAAEIAVCLPFLQRLAALAAPRRMVLLGPLPARALLGAAPRRKTPEWLSATLPGLAAPVPALVLPDPEALRAKPAGRREAWAGLRLLRRALDGDFTKL